mmetsp:Transcript_10588/g.39221  ORF Transcript_10588/g.39221 Transcript_10588/m.39221 type:complete len:327 (+) Transcript_10588:3020-4000(+)
MWCRLCAGMASHTMDSQMRPSLNRRSSARSPQNARKAFASASSSELGPRSTKRDALSGSRMMPIHILKCSSSTDPTVSSASEAFRFFVPGCAAASSEGRISEALTKLCCCTRITFARDPRVFVAISSTRASSARQLTASASHEPDALVLFRSIVTCRCTSYRTAGYMELKNTCSNAVLCPRSRTAAESAASCANSAIALFDTLAPMFTFPSGPMRTNGKARFHRPKFCFAALNPPERTLGSARKVSAAFTSCCASMRGLSFPPVVTRWDMSMDSTKPVNPSGAPSIPRLAAHTLSSKHASSKYSTSAAASRKYFPCSSTNMSSRID